jgi:hypothetical protein
MDEQQAPIIIVVLGPPGIISTADDQERTVNGGRQSVK